MGKDRGPNLFRQQVVIADMILVAVRVDDLPNCLVRTQLRKYLTKLVSRPKIARIHQQRLIDQVANGIIVAANVCQRPRQEIVNANAYHSVRNLVYVTLHCCDVHVKVAQRAEWGQPRFR